MRISLLPSRNVLLQRWPTCISTDIELLKLAISVVKCIDKSKLHRDTISIASELTSIRELLLLGLPQRQPSRRYQPVS
jgi:hypothetical protein